jgi:hypothetical protein
VPKHTLINHGSGNLLKIRRPLLTPEHSNDGLMKGQSNQAASFRVSGNLT